MEIHIQQNLLFLTPILLLSFIQFLAILLTHLQRTVYICIETTLMITMPQEKSLSACCTIEDGKGNLVEDGCLSPLQAGIRQLVNLLVFFQ